MLNKDDEIKIGIALGGGAALGFAHYGVLKVLEDYKVKISFIAGTSMGSVMGGFYASGLSPYEFRNKLDGFSFNKIARFNGFKVLKESLYNTDRMACYIAKLIDNKKVETTKIPYRCVAVDLYTGKPYVFKKGDLCEAIRASCAVPGIFSPIIKDEKYLVDGGVLNNVPYDVVEDMGADFIIGVNVNPRYKKRGNLETVDKVVMSAFRLMLNDKEKMRLADFPKEKGYLLNINSEFDEMDFSHEAVVSAYNLGMEIAQKHIGKILKEIKKIKKQKNGEK